MRGWKVKKAACFFHFSDLFWEKSFVMESNEVLGYRGSRV